MRAARARGRSAGSGAVATRNSDSGSPDISNESGCENFEGAMQ